MKTKAEINEEIRLYNEAQGKQALKAMLFFFGLPALLIALFVLTA